jgi:hypothetical protein
MPCPYDDHCDDHCDDPPPLTPNEAKRLGGDMGKDKKGILSRIQIKREKMMNINR